MSCHFYLLRASLKNRFGELLKKPGKLVMYLVVLLAFGAALAATLFGAAHTSGRQPASYLMLIFFGFLLLFYGMAVQKGLASGDSVFGMNDVNFLFVAPVNPRATLFYGLIKLAGTSFLAGFFLLFQSSTLASFGLGFDGVLILFAAYMLNMMVLTLLSQAIYSATNGRPGRKRVARVLAVALFAPLLVALALRFFATGSFLQALADIAVSPVLAATPFIGWASAGAIALATGSLLPGLGWLGLLVLSGAGLLLYLMRSRSDYYEDVLVATETAFEKARATAEGDMQAAFSTAARAKVRGTGLAGRGAHVFLFKHLRETFRQNRFGFFSLYMLITAACIIGASLFLFDGGDLPLVLQILMWMQIFMVGTGRGLLELYTHYLYMAPASPFQKAVWSNMELVVRTVAESVLFLGIPGLIMGSDLLVILGSMAVYVLFTLLLLGINYLSIRWTEANLSQGMLMVLYFFVVVLFMLPGLAAALFVGFSVGGQAGPLLALLILSVWELLVALVCFFLSKDVLHNCDMASMKP